MIGAKFSFSSSLFWLNNARYVALPQSFLPAVVALIYAQKETTFSWILGLLAVAGVEFAHLALNLFDDYFDYRKNPINIRERMASSGMRARIGKCDYITSGNATISQLVSAALAFGIVAAVPGVIISLYQGWPILIFMGTALLLGLFYSAPPFRFSYRGFGEIIIAAVFGPLLMGGVYYAASGTLNNALWFTSIPIGILIANILYTHDVMDFEVDKKIGKKTLCVIFDNRNIHLKIASLFIFTPYFFIIGGYLFQFLSSWMLLTLITLPQAITLYWLLFRFVRNPQHQYTPKWWMQPMERWKKIEKAGIDWFMIRWYLARNLLITFCLSLIVAIIASQ